MKKKVKKSDIQVKWIIFKEKFKIIYRGWKRRKFIFVLKAQTSFDSCEGCKYQSRRRCEQIKISGKARTLRNLCHCNEIVEFLVKYKQPFRYIIPDERGTSTKFKGYKPKNYVG